MMRMLVLTILTLTVSASAVTITLVDEASVPAGYTVELPAEFDSTRSYPLIVAIHGLGDRMEAYFGTNDRLCPEGAIGLYPESPYPMFSEEPGPLGFTWEIWTDSTHWLHGPSTAEASIAWILRSIELVRQRYPVDVDRIFLFGFSQGGWLTFEIGLRVPDLFAGLLPAGGWLAWDSARSLDPAALSTPIRILHGVNDDVCRFDQARQAFDTLSARGVPVELMRYPAKHQLTRELFEDARDFVWCVLHRGESQTLTNLLFPEEVLSPGLRLDQLQQILLVAEPDSVVAAALLRLYPNETAEAREKIVYVLGARRCLGAENLLREALQDQKADPKLRQTAYSALIKLGTESAWRTVEETELEVAVRDVVPGSQAAELGVRPGDVVTSYDGKPIFETRDIHDAKAGVEEDREEVIMIIRRGEEEIELTLKPGSIGIWTEDRPK